MKRDSKNAVKKKNLKLFSGSYSLVEPDGNIRTVFYTGNLQEKVSGAFKNSYKSILYS